MAAFTELGVMPEIVNSLDKMHWLLPTEIQAEAIPLILGGGDVLMASETGTGKTGAFCIPIVQVVYEQLLQSGSQSNEVSTKNYCDSNEEITLSVADRDQDLVLSTDLLTVQSKSGQWQGCRTNKGIKRSRTGRNPRVYYEVFFADQGLARVGWSFGNARLELGLDNDGWGYGGTAKKSNSKQFSEYGQTFGEKFDIVGCIVDLNNGEISFTKNGKNMGVAFKLSMSKLENQVLYPTICVKNAGCQVRLGPVQEKDDYRPKDCFWISEIRENLVINPACGSTITADRTGPLAIIMEPSRELAKQTFDCIQKFSGGLDINSVLIVGGTNDNPNEYGNKTHVIVATPGRLSETISRGQISLRDVHFFILDEADGLLQQGQESFIRSVAAKLPRMFESGRRMQTVCCSATLHDYQVKKLAQDLMYFPTWIDLKGEDSVPETVHHVVLRVNPVSDLTYAELDGLFSTDGVHANDNVESSLFGSHTKLSRPEELSEAVKLLKFYYTLTAIENLKMDQGIIFCRTKVDCDNLNEFMLSMCEKTRSNKYTCVRLHSSLSQQERINNLETFKRQQVRFLICTDVAARGIDICGVPFVIQVTLPDDKASYVHRIGRVGRAERMGLAISLVASVPEKVWYHRCRKRECQNTRVIEKGGCCKWFDELTMLAEIEDHLKCNIQEIERDFKLQVDEFHGKIVYGAKRLEQSCTYEGHVEQLAKLVCSLGELEARAQANFINSYY